MIELPATLTKSHLPRWEFTDSEKLQSFIGYPLLTTRTHSVIGNAPINPTIAAQFSTIQQIPKCDRYLLGAKDNSVCSIIFVFHSTLFSSKDATATHTYILNSLFNLSSIGSNVLGGQLVPQSVTLPENPYIPSQIIQEEEEQETIYADTNRALSFKDLVSALDRISHSTEREDIPLPFDPDDYPVV